MIALHILYVDDEPDIREIIDLSLGLDPLLVLRGCASGSEALAIAAHWRPDLILLDVTMPGLDGPTTLQQLRASPHTARIPIVFMTAHARTRECERFIGLGAAGVIAKPFDPISLAALVRTFVPAENKLAPLRDGFLRRLRSNAADLVACDSDLTNGGASDALVRIKAIAHSLAGASGIYGFAGISCESMLLEEAVDRAIAGESAHEVGFALTRLLARMKDHDATIAAGGRHPGA